MRRASLTPGRRAVLALPYLWLGAFFALPLLIVLQISFSTAVDGSPPYAELWARDGGWLPSWRGSLASYALLLGDDLYLVAFLNSVRIAALSTAICLAIGYPVAYAIARAPERRRGVLLLLVALPFWTSFLIRVYAWMALLRPTGLINNALAALGLIDEPLELMNNEFAVTLGIVYSYLPFMILPLYASLEKQDPAWLEAAADLGARPFAAFWGITLPQSLPGIAAGCLLVFVPAIGEFVIPELLGGPDSPMIGRVLWTEFFSNRDWPVAAAVAVALLIALVAPFLALQRLRGRGEEAP